VGRSGTPGIVTEWDDPRGVGTVRTADGRDLPFQCTDLADGSRTTSVGARVTVAIVPGHHGRWQAVAITPEG
jgi:cold shock CspA family protein